MAWFKVDDGLHASRKLLSIPKRTRFAAVGLWTIAGSWSADQLTDGTIPDYMLDVFGAPPSAPQALVDAGLWEREQGSYVFRNWHEYQPSKQDVDAERAASRERMRELRARRKQPKQPEQREEGEVFGRTGPNGSENVRNPDPTRPDPTHIEEANASSKPRKRAPRATRIPDGWTPTDELAQAMSMECPTVNQQAEHRKFVDYWTAKSGKDATKADWNATYRNWIRRAAENAPQRNMSSSDRRLQHGLGVVQRAGSKTAPANPFEGRELTA